RDLVAGDDDLLHRGRLVLGVPGRDEEGRADTVAAEEVEDAAEPGLARIAAVGVATPERPVGDRAALDALAVVVDGDSDRALVRLGPGVLGDHARTSRYPCSGTKPLAGSR